MHIFFCAFVHGSEALNVNRRFHLLDVFYTFMSIGTFVNKDCLAFSYSVTNSS